MGFYFSEIKLYSLVLGNVYYMRSFTVKRFHWVMLWLSAKYQSYDQPS